MANKTNTEKLVEITGFDVVEMVKVYAANVAEATDRLTDPAIKADPNKLGDLRDDIYSLYKFGVEVNKMGRELCDSFDDMVKLMYELDVDGFNVRKIREPKPRNTQGRRKMTQAERIEAAQKRLLEKRNAEDSEDSDDED